MSDNTTLNLGTGGDVIASDDVAGVKYQVVKLATGADGAADLVSNSAPIPVSDAGGALTVDGTVAATQSGAWSVTNVSGTVSLPTGAATAAKQPALGTAGTASADVISVQGIASMTPLQVSDAGGSLTVDNGGTFAVQVTAISAGDNNIGNVDVVSLPALAAGTNNIGDVDVLSLPALPAGSNAIGTVTAVGAAAENAAVSGSPVLVGGRYDSSPRTLGNGDVGAAALNASGQMLVEIAAGAGSGGTAAADDADFTAGTTSGTPVMGVYESTPTSVTDGDLGAIGITVNREVKVSVTSGGVAGVVEDAASAGGEEGVLMLAVRRDTAASSSGTDGDFSTLNTDSTGRLHVNVGNTVTVGSHAVTNAGTFAVQVSSIAAGDNNIGNVDIVSLPASTNTLEVVGDAAHDAAVAGNPVLVGFEARSTAPTAVADGDAVRGAASLLGKQIVLPYAIPASTWAYASTAAVTDTADDEAAAAVASTRRYITGVQVFNGHDTVGTEVVIKDGSTVMWRGWAEQTGGGCSAKFDPPLRGTANTAVNVANITTGSSTYFNLQGFSATE